jgi:hypothetical protein
MGPRKNLEYRTRRAVSRFDKARRDNRGVEEPDAVSGQGVGVVVPEETGVPITGGRLDSMPVEVCLSSSVEGGRVSLVYMHFLDSRRR